MKIEVDIDLPTTGIGKVDATVKKTAEQLKENISNALKGISDISEISNVAGRLFSFDDLTIEFSHGETKYRYVVASVGTTLMNTAGGESHVIRRYKYYIDYSRRSRLVGIPPVDSMGHHFTSGGGGSRD